MKKFSIIGIVGGIIGLIVIVSFGFFYYKNSVPASSLFIYINSSSDNIVVDLPFPNAVTGKDFCGVCSCPDEEFENSNPCSPYP